MIWVKTTVEISDELLKRSRRLAKRRGTTLRAILEEGLRLALKAHRQPPPADFKLPTFGEHGLTDEFRNAPWEKIRDTIHGSPDRDEP